MDPEPLGGGAKQRVKFLVDSKFSKGSPEMSNKRHNEHLKEEVPTVKSMRQRMRRFSVDRYVDTRIREGERLAKERNSILD